MVLHQKRGVTLMSHTYPTVTILEGIPSGTNWFSILSKNPMTRLVVTARSLSSVALVNVIEVSQYDPESGR